MVASIISKANFNIQTKERTADIVAYITQYITNIISGWIKRIQFVFVNPETVFQTKFVPLEVSIMIDNFVTNSDKAGAHGITMKFSANDEILRILVSDDGRGISEEDRQLVFKRGFTTTIGSGIGLNHIMTIAQKMNGNVEFVGNGVAGMDSGACFEVTINANRR